MHIKLMQNLFLIIVYTVSTFTGIESIKSVDQSATGFMISMNSAFENSIPIDDVVINTQGSANLFNYFANLTSNLGDNPSNNCVSVACGMIASYYDTYYNDNIVPEIYDVQAECINYGFETYYSESSPGVFSQLPSNCLYNDETINYQAYNQYLNNYNDFVYEVIGVDIDSQTNTFARVDHHNTMSPLAGAVSSRLSNVSTASFSFEIGYGNSIEDCKEAIDNGYPVFIRLYNGTIDHAVVAFAYDENDNIYYHTGYKLINNYGIEMIDYRYIFWSFVVSPSDGYTHVCSDNYYSIDNITEEITYYCPCMLNDMSYPNHAHSITHNVDYSFDENDEIEFDVTHYESCSSCDLFKVVSCGIDHFVQTQNNQHLIYFSCNQIVVQDHYVVDIAPITGDHHYLMCICGIFDYEHHDDIWIYIDNVPYQFCICGIFFSSEQYEIYIQILRDYLYDYDYDEDLIEEIIDYITLYFSNTE